VGVPDRGAGSIAGSFLHANGASVSVASSAKEMKVREEAVGGGLASTAGIFGPR
jgi:hypothetical protein